MAADLLTLISEHESPSTVQLSVRFQRSCWCRVVLETYLPIITKVSFFIFAFPFSEMEARHSNIAPNTEVYYRKHYRLRCLGG